VRTGSSARRSAFPIRRVTVRPGKKVEGCSGSGLIGRRSFMTLPWERRSKESSKNSGLRTVRPTLTG